MPPLDNTANDSPDISPDSSPSSLSKLGASHFESLLATGSGDMDANHVLLWSPDSDPAEDFSAISTSPVNNNALGIELGQGLDQERSIEDGRCAYPPFV